MYSTSTNLKAEVTILDDTNSRYTEPKDPAHGMGKDRTQKAEAKAVEVVALREALSLFVNAGRGQ